MKILQRSKVVFRVAVPESLITNKSEVVKGVECMRDRLLSERPEYVFLKIVYYDYEMNPHKTDEGRITVAFIFFDLK